MTAQRRRQRSRGWAGPDQPTPGSAADETPEADPESVAKGIVLRRLTAAPRSRSELAADLAARDVPDDVATKVLDRFTEVGLVDDQAYAQMLVRTRRDSRGLARRALQQELRRKGVGDEEAAAALESVTADDEVATAEALVAKRLPSTRGLSYETRVRRLAGMLARKGYNAGLAHRVVRDAITAEGPGTWRPSAESDLHVDSIPDGGQDPSVQDDPGSAAPDV